MSLSKTCNVNNNERLLKSVDVSEWLLKLRLSYLHTYLLTLCVDNALEYVHYALQICSRAVW